MAMFHVKRKFKNKSGLTKCSVSRETFPRTPRTFFGFLSQTWFWADSFLKKTKNSQKRPFKLIVSRETMTGSKFQCLRLLEFRIPWPGFRCFTWNAETRTIQKQQFIMFHVKHGGRLGHNRQKQRWGHGWHNHVSRETFHGEAKQFLFFWRSCFFALVFFWKN